ncbi:MAG: bifunctional diaminohydroxyphosphoribosylaminopyrimidine deaminase/5-amino-6-(5-phosphoribosylamino)uracil reductase RibD [Candidatus Omnitrophota bacterium]
MLRKDIYYMQAALKQALHAQGRTRPNPMVGAVLVKNGKIISRGYHKKAGSAHAEAAVLKKAGRKAAGAALYVTMEPCTHYGRTPPCVHQIISSGVNRVVIGVHDPNPINCRQGISFLKKHRIKIKVLNFKPAQDINYVYNKYITRKIPYVTLKVAASLDGKIATSTGESKWITSVKSRAYVHKIRKDVDAIIIGINTLMQDNPLLITHMPLPRVNPCYRHARKNALHFSDLLAYVNKSKKMKQPIKVILDTKLRATPNLNIFSNKSPQLTIIVTDYLQKRKVGKFKNKNVHFLFFKAKNGKIRLRELLKKLAEIEISHVLIEGGAQIFGSAFDAGVVDHVMFFISPMIIGGDQAPNSIGGRGVSSLARAHKLKKLKISQKGHDLLIEGDI